MRGVLISSQNVSARAVNRNIKLDVVLDAHKSDERHTWATHKKEAWFHTFCIYEPLWYRMRDWHNKFEMANANANLRKILYIAAEQLCKPFAEWKTKFIHTKKQLYCGLVWPPHNFCQQKSFYYKTCTSLPFSCMEYTHRTNQDCIRPKKKYTNEPLTCMEWFCTCVRSLIRIVS